MDERRRAARQRIDAIVRAYVAGYALHGHYASYTPEDSERTMIRDAINGLLARPDFVEAVAALSNTTTGE